MKESVTQRIMTFLKNKKMSIKELADIIGMNQPTLNRQLNGENALSGNTILYIISKFPDISAEWLLRGEGAMERALNVENSEKTIINQPTNSDNSGVNITDSEVLSDMINEIKEMREQNAKLIEQNIKLTNILIGK